MAFWDSHLGWCLSTDRGLLAADPLPQIPQSPLFHSPIMQMRHGRYAQKNQKKEDGGGYY